MDPSAVTAMEDRVRMAEIALSTIRGDRTKLLIENAALCAELKVRIAFAKEMETMISDMTKALGGEMNLPRA